MLTDALVDRGKFHEAHATFTEAIAALDAAGYRSHPDVRDGLLHGLAILHKRTQPAEHARDLALFVAGSRALDAVGATVRAGAPRTGCRWTDRCVCGSWWGSPRRLDPDRVDAHPRPPVEAARRA